MTVCAICAKDYGKCSCGMEMYEEPEERKPEVVIDGSWWASLFVVFFIWFVGLCCGLFIALFVLAK